MGEVISFKIEKSKYNDKVIKIFNSMLRKVNYIRNFGNLDVNDSLKYEATLKNCGNVKAYYYGNELIGDNILNNNSLVFKIEYKEFKMLFTGDVEQIAEEKILNKYTDILESTILKVAHHGSKTSTIKGFVQAVKPQIALIGVGVNNNFGHPNNDVIKRLERVRC